MVEPNSQTCPWIVSKDFFLVDPQLAELAEVTPAGVCAEEVLGRLHGPRAEKLNTIPPVTPACQGVCRWLVELQAEGLA
jgi:hypothetical protein